jgi:hypothetical protein
MKETVRATLGAAAVAALDGKGIDAINGRQVCAYNLTK